MRVSNEQIYIDRQYDISMPRNFQRSKDLLREVYSQQVKLENVFTRGLTVYGTVRVNNCSFDKSIFVRFTLDQWKTVSEIDANHSEYCADNNTDIFRFKLSIDIKTLLSTSPFPRRILMFAIRYKAGEKEFWDNNNARNYEFEIVERLQQKSNRTADAFLFEESIVSNNILQKQIAQDYEVVLNDSTQTVVACGLKNLGGTCYMNSVLQSLFFTVSLTNYVLSGENSQYFIMKENLISGTSVANEYLNILYLLYCRQYTRITPAPFKQNQSNTISNTNSYHSFNSTSKHSIITDLFYGMYRTTTTCLHCMNTSHMLEPFVNLVLPIPLENRCKLEDCLQHLNEDEYLVDDVEWFCSQCQCLRHCTRRQEILKLPKILIIQLKRFQKNHHSDWIKNETLVEYPEFNFDLKNIYSLSSSEHPLYRLYAVINHHGTLNDGHYTTFCRDTIIRDPRWFECDDEKIRYLRTDEIQTNSKAYLLFYTMKNIDEMTEL